MERAVAAVAAHSQLLRQPTSAAPAPPPPLQEPAPGDGHVQEVTAGQLRTARPILLFKHTPSQAM